jgi:myo-inositol-1(or 4)-monophosphatase
MPWDRAAGELLVTEAGGRVSSLAALGPSGAGVLAAGPALHDALRELVGGANAEAVSAQAAR